MATTTTKARRTGRLNLRTTPKEERVIETAASKQGVSVSKFVVKSAYDNAENVLADEHHFEIPSNRWKAFLDALDRPVQPKPRLKKLFSEPSALEP